MNWTAPHVVCGVIRQPPIRSRLEEVPWRKRLGAKVTGPGRAVGYTGTQIITFAQDMCDMQEYAWHAVPCLDEKESGGWYVPVCLPWRGHKFVFLRL